MKLIKGILYTLLLVALYLVLTIPEEEQVSFISEKAHSEPNKSLPALDLAKIRKVDYANFKRVEKPETTREEVEHSKGFSEATKSLHKSMDYVDKNDYGYSPRLTQKNAEESVQLRSIIEASKDPVANASRFSAAIEPKPFNKDRYLNDPKYKSDYLTEVEPGRAFLTDPKAANPLKRISPYLQTVEQGSTVELSVQGVPGAPVSITSFDLGKFDNHLTFQTVEADSSGIARFTFHGMEGTIEDTNILVASPMSKNSIKFIINTQISSEKLNSKNSK
ncbi:MAG: hypothetical protein NE334_21300 [Lentisphaeraceae bacterium]|nr:hypothetical protein [Lentisphaeraceae bacterium]